VKKRRMSDNRHSATCVAELGKTTIDFPSSSLFILHIRSMEAIGQLNPVFGNPWSRAMLSQPLSSKRQMETMKTSRTVMFSEKADRVIPRRDDEELWTTEFMKSLWYTREELMNSCLEAKAIVAIINSVNGNLDAIDHSKICIVGLEKYHDKKAKDNNRKMLIKSVLIRQELNRFYGLPNDINCLCEISELLSCSFKEYALWQAAMHAFHAHGRVSSSSFTWNVLNEKTETLTENRAKRQRTLEGYC